MCSINRCATLDMNMQVCECSLRTRRYVPCTARYSFLCAKACMELHRDPAALLVIASLQLAIQTCAVPLFQNASVLPYHSAYESVLAFVGPMVLECAETCPRFLDKTHPGPVKKK